MALRVTAAVSVAISRLVLFFTLWHYVTIFLSYENFLMTVIHHLMSFHDQPLAFDLSLAFAFIFTYPPFILTCDLDYNGLSHLLSALRPSFLANSFLAPRYHCGLQVLSCFNFLTSDHPN